MDTAKLRTAIISADREIRAAVADTLREVPELVAVVADVPAPAGELDGEALELLREKDPELVIADFGNDPVSALRYLRLLSDARPSRAFVGCGPELAPELLMDAMRAGISDYLTAPARTRELTEAVRRAAKRLGRGSPTSAPGRIVVFSGAKGGTGVSTAAVNAASHTAELTKRRTLLLDLDLESGSTGVLTRVSTRYSVLDLIENVHRLDESLLSSLVSEGPAQIHVLPAPAEVVDTGTMQPEQLQTVCRMLRQHYPLIIVDLARPLSPVGRAVLAQTDELFLVLGADLPSLRNARRILPHLRRAMEPRGEPEIRLLLNRYVVGGEIGPDDVQKALESPVDFTLRRDEDEVLHSVNVGNPIALNGGRSRYADDVRALGLDLARSLDPDLEARGSGGLLDRIKTRLAR